MTCKQCGRQTVGGDFCCGHCEIEWHKADMAKEEDAKNKDKEATKTKDTA